MSLDALLAARSHIQGRALRTATKRHRCITPEPIGIVAWELGAEPYVVGSIALGVQARAAKVYVPGNPLNRDLLFAALTPFAREFNRAFEAPMASACGTRKSRFGREIPVPMTMPQVVVPNEQTVRLLWRLGRRLAYLPLDGERPADEALVRMGRHFMWLADHGQTPGQQLILSVTDLLRRHWATPMSDYEAGSLAALEAWIEPPAGRHGFQAAAEAELVAIGPVPDPNDGTKVHELRKAFMEACAGSTAPRVAQRHIGPLKQLYNKLTQRTWNLMFHALDRERALPEAASVTRRVAVDRLAYAEHMFDMNSVMQGRRRARRNFRQAIRRKYDLEHAKAVLDAEEAIDDPLRMLPQLLAGRAIAGEVVLCRPQRRELINNRSTLRPSVTLRVDAPCNLPLSSKVWWSRAASCAEWIVQSIALPIGGHQDVELVLQTNRQLPAGLPSVGQRARFTQVCIPSSYTSNLPRQVPWTHRAPDPVLDNLNEDDAGLAQVA